MPSTSLPRPSASQRFLDALVASAAGNIPSTPASEVELGRSRGMGSKFQFWRGWRAKPQVPAGKREGEREGREAEERRGEEEGGDTDCAYNGLSPHTFARKLTY